MEVGGWLQRAAAAHPQRTAVNGLTYAALDREAAAAAQAFSAADVARGDRVAIALPAGQEFAIALHACLRLGAVAVPIDLRLGDAERSAQVAGCAMVVDSPPPRADAHSQARVTHDLDAVAVVIHTSGTAGAPKAVELTYGNWLWSALGSGAALGVNRDERWLCALPLSHVGGLSILIRSAIYSTAAVVHERFDTDAALAELSAPDGATLVSLVPTTLQRLLEAGLERPPRLRCALVGGGPVGRDLLRRARGARIPVAQTYGLSETCSQVTTAAPGDEADDAGPPLFCSRVRIDAAGEIQVAGPTVAHGAAGRDGWLATGDLGSLGPDGRLTVTGRAADTIVTGGENVAPAEVEAVLCEHPAVAEALVHGIPDDRWGEAVAARVVLVPGAQADMQALFDFCRQRLAGFKCPKAIHVQENLPRTASGKVLRRTNV